MVHTSPSINLAKGKEKSFFEKFINWALTFGRFVVIITELIALSAFLYRFSLDRQLIDLNDKIMQKQTVIKFSKVNEDTYRNLQQRLLLASQFNEQGVKFSSVLSDVVHFAPGDFIFTTISLSSENLRIEATTTSVQSLSNFVKSLKEYPRIASVSLDKIENKTQSATIVVGLSATIKK